jgi:hypothetical protein
MNGTVSVINGQTVEYANQQGIYLEKCVPQNDIYLSSLV